MRLWTGKTTGRFIEFDNKSFLFMLTLGKEVRTEFGVIPCTLVTVGLDKCFKFGYFVDYYDGFWKSVWVGPFFVSWFS